MRGGDLVLRRDLVFGRDLVLRRELVFGGSLVLGWCFKPCGGLVIFFSFFSFLLFIQPAYFYCLLLEGAYVSNTSALYVRGRDINVIAILHRNSHFHGSTQWETEKEEKT